MVKCKALLLVYIQHPCVCACVKCVSLRQYYVIVVRPRKDYYGLVIQSVAFYNNIHDWWWSRVGSGEAAKVRGLMYIVCGFMLAVARQWMTSNR